MGREKDICRDTMYFIAPWGKNHCCFQMRSQVEKKKNVRVIIINLL